MITPSRVGREKLLFGLGCWRRASIFPSSVLFLHVSSASSASVSAVSTKRRQFKNSYAPQGVVLQRRKVLVSALFGLNFSNEH